MIWWLFVTTLLIQAGYVLFFFCRILSVRKYPAQGERRRVTVIICGRNEAVNLAANLPAILDQQYVDESGRKNYEVIVVNDASTDNTEALLQTLEKQYDLLRHITLPPGETRVLKGKKHALSAGIAQATGQWIVLTDADCRPASSNWLELITAPLSCNKEIVAGYGRYRKAPGSLNAFIRWETMHTFLQYSTYALAGIPYMAVGRNMACTKNIADSVIDDPRWNATASGDDDMLVSLAGGADNVAMVCDPRSFTLTDAKVRWAGWAKQKQRHLSTGKYYRPGIKLLLGFYGIAHALAWLCFFILSGTVYARFAVLLMAVRCLALWLTWAVTASRLSELSLLPFFPLFDLGWLVYNFAFFPFITLKNKEQWK